MRAALSVQNKSLKKAGELSLDGTRDVIFKCCPSSGKGSYWPETLRKSLYWKDYFDDLYRPWETHMSYWWLHPFIHNRMRSTKEYPISNSSERLWGWWLHVYLSNLGVCSKLAWKMKHIGKEEIHLIISLRILEAPIFMGKLSFQIKLTYTSYHKNRTVTKKFLTD